jgi:cytochrome c biogenesis protein CcmG, thiol:disulfide interchange protein DsbE
METRTVPMTDNTAVSGPAAAASPEGAAAGRRRGPLSMLRSPALVPLLLFLVLAVLFGVGLTMNPRNIPSPLIGKPVPEFSLPPVKGRTLGLSSADLKGEPSLVNVFASWCTACREEHPLLMDLKARGVIPIHGLNYKDRPQDAERWLNDLGDSYTRTGADIDGRVGIEWGVYGVPETFVVNREGVIVYKHIGALTERVLAEKLLPLIQTLQE